MSLDMELQGDPVPGYPCPKCGGLVVYNGNYFCNWFRLEGPRCDWALAHHDPQDSPAEHEAEKREEALLYALLMEYRERADADE